MGQDNLFNWGGQKIETAASKKVNSIGKQTSSNESDSTKAVFLIPLRSSGTGEIKSYITAYKHNDTSYSYRLYNKDSLYRIHPVGDSAALALRNTEAIFGVFEKTVNNKDSIETPDGVIRNASLSLSSGNLQSSRSANSVRVNQDYCTVSITFILVYEWRDFSYVYGNQWVLAGAIIQVDVYCWSTPDGGGNGSTGGHGPINNEAEWWQYGSGWPWINPGLYSGYGDPWNYWWSSGINTYNPYSQSNLDAYANLLGKYWEDPAYDVNSYTFPPYDPAVDGPYDAQGYRKNGPEYTYSGGVVQNYTNDNGGKYAVFTDQYGQKTTFPGATITDFGVQAHKGVTTHNGGIHAASTFKLADLQHEYGHYLQAQSVGIAYYYGVIVPASLYSAATSPPAVHNSFWTEVDANHYAISFFGPNSAIALDPTNFPR